ncbi:hypothetical protein EUGRSUZ_J00846 [Eucalyptus grandis]|uniref:Uncharacterized protein n=2 Tax=Eucalyptus grandis TaxID=71139 RepID=A0ACC3J4R1_EUCGR|nr:hypothetical protein EUGRSUZ_J00846 [Eucalyptus grandis]
MKTTSITDDDELSNLVSPSVTSQTSPALPHRVFSLSQLLSALPQPLITLPLGFFFSTHLSSLSKSDLMLLRTPKNYQK